MPAEPRPAATIILMRHGGRHGARGLEVLLLRRSAESSFMAGVWVFPGGVVEAVDAAGDEDAAHRACALRELREEAGVSLPDSAELVSYSRWITPEAVPVRFDTRFYLALAPPHAEPRPDGVETVEARWLSPRRALSLGGRGQLQLVFPTIRHLESLSGFDTPEEALASARDREVEPILPRVIGEGDGRRVVLPGEPGYE